MARDEWKALVGGAARIFLAYALILRQLRTIWDVPRTWNAPYRQQAVPRLGTLRER